MKKILSIFLPLTRKRAALILLVVYWPVIFILTHIIVPPPILSQMQASDKSLHFLVYFILIVMFWFSISPEKKAGLRSKKVWIVFLILISYAAIDEWLQGLSAERTRDFMDFVANAEGLAAGLVLIFLFSFWPAALLATAISILVFTSAVRIQFTGSLAFIRPLVLFLSFGFFTFLWCEFLTVYQPIKQSRLKWLIASAALPFVLIATVKLLTRFTGRAFELEDFVLSTLAIIIIVAIMFIVRNQTRN
jgi:VanZ family protein